MNNIDKRYFLQAIDGSQMKEISPEDISVKCPICGDSKIHRNSKRLHLYTKNDKTLVHCFNGDCPVGQRSVFSFIRDFYPSLLEAYRHDKFREKIENGTLQTEVRSMSENHEVKDIFDFGDKEQDTPAETKSYDADIICQDFSQYFKEVQGTPAEAYLLSRGFTLSDLEGIPLYYANIQLKIGETNYPLVNSIVIPMVYKGVMYGFYSRSITEKKFYTYNHEHNMGYKLWNYFNIDRDQPVYIFEGIFDALSAYKCGVENVIACMGAKIPPERINELKEPIFFLDNDKTGLVNALNYCNKGYKVVVLPEGYPKDANEMLLKGHDVKSLINNYTYSGIMGVIKIRQRLS